MSAKGLIDLAMDYASRMARAKEQGFDADQVYYHGSDKDIKEFQPSRIGELGGGVYFTNLPKEAAGYAGKKAGANIAPTRIKGNFLEVDSVDDFWSRFGGDSDEQAVINAIDAGYDGIKYKRPYQYFDNDQKKFINTDEMQTHVNVFDPKNIRSTNAAFDPAKKDSSNLLASAGGLGLLGMAMSEDADAGVATKTLGSILESAKNSGVKLDVFEDKKSGVLELSRIVVPEKSKGVGSSIMDELSNYADSTGQTMTLSPTTDFGGSSKSRLTNFYKRFGFVQNKGRNKDYSFRNTMYRAPKVDKKHSSDLLGSADPRLLAATALGTGTAVAAPKAKGIISMIGDTALEAMSGVNRAAVDGANFLTTDQINAALNLSGSDKRVPNLYGIPGIEGGTEGNYMEPGLLRQFVREASGLLSPI